MVEYDILAKYFHQLLTIESCISSMLVLNEIDETCTTQCLLISQNKESVSEIFFEEFTESFQKGWCVHERESQQEASVAAYLCDQAKTIVCFGF